MQNKEEIQFKNNHQKALEFELDILEMLIENNSIRETVMCLSEEVFLENEGEISEFLKCKERAEKEETHYRGLYEGAKLAGLIDDPIRALNDMPVNGDRF